MIEENANKKSSLLNTYKNAKIKMHPKISKNAENAYRNCKNHTKNATNDMSGITDILPGLSPYWLSPIISFHHFGYPRYYRDILESVKNQG
jgi:hypothetical protein